MNINKRTKLHNIKSLIVCIAVVTILALFPLVYHNFYFDILNFKYKFYYVTALFMIASITIITLTELIGSLKSGKKIGFSKNFNLIYIILAVFAVVCIISTAQSDYLYEAMWGNEGRYTGLFLILVYVCSFFCISKLLKFKQWQMDIFLITGLLVCLFGITDYFNMDVLHFKVDMVEADRKIFMSTIGNINTYTTYVALVLAIATGMFIVERNKKRLCFYYVCTIISLFALVFGMSDNAYLSLAALLGLTPLWAFKTKGGFARYVLLIATLFSALQIIDWINSKWSDKVIGIESLFKMMSDSQYLLYILAAMWLITIIIFFMNRGRLEEPLNNIYIKIWIGILTAGVLAVCIILYDVNIAGNAERYGGLQSYLLFNDTWGTNRGYIWKVTLDEFSKFSFARKLFGFGADTFGILVYDYRYETGQRFGQYYDSAHNEYLQYLVTIGLLGLLSYLSVLAASLWKIIKTVKDKPCLIGIALAVICYMAQATVNISVPITAPIMWTLLAVGVAAGREKSIEIEE